MFARLAELVRCDHWPPRTGATSLASGLEACMGALPDQIALKLGKRAEDVEHQHPARRGGVEVLGERAEPDTSQIGRATCREIVCKYVSYSVVADSFKQTQTTQYLYKPKILE